MDELTIAERVREPRREISEIEAFNRAYRASSHLSVLDTDMHEKVHQRLEEIKEELAVLQPESAAKTRAVSSHFTRDTRTLV